MVFSIVILLITSQAILQFMIDLDNSNLERIDIAGQQRMLSQKITTNYIKLQNDTYSGEKDEIIDELKTFIILIKKNNASIQYIRDGSAFRDYSISKIENFSKPAYFDSLEIKITPHIATCQHNIEIIEKKLNNPEFKKLIPNSIIDQNILLDLSHQYVQALQEKAHNEIRLLRITEIILSVMVILTLIIELIYVIQPMMRKLKEQNDSLNQLNEIKTRFIGMVAHDLRNPLAVIQQYSEIIANNKAKAKSQEDHKHISVIQASSKFMLDIVNELLDVSIIESNSFKLTKTNTSISELIKGAVSLNNIFADKKNITLTVKSPDADILCSVDQSKMIQVLNNLISNAVKYSHENTTVLTEFLMKEDNFIIKVTDQGQGIKEEELKSLFKPFVTTSTKSTAGEKSIGLGLTIVQKIIEAHNGSISVQSKIGVGTVFEIIIPYVKTSDDKVESKEREVKVGQDHEYSNAEPRILVCEDDPLLQLLMKRVFKSFQINALYADDGQKGLELIKENKNIDLVFTDINMPLMDGYELSRQINLLEREIKVVALSGVIDSEIKEKFTELGVDLCLEKPISKSELASIIRLD